MADINVERRGPSIWPWIIGLLVLALLIWAIAEMVNTEREGVSGIETVEKPVTAVPTPTPPEAAVAPVPLDSLAPLGPQDAGRMVTVDGTVVGQPTDQGFWVETQIGQQPNVMFVQVPARTENGQMLQSQNVRTGQSVRLVGMLEPIPTGLASTWIGQAELMRDPNFQTWNVHEDLMLSSAQSGQQPTQPMQPAQPGDTVQGRY